MNHLTELKKELFTIIKEKVYLYKEEPFTLVSGIKSHHYFNCKNLTFYPHGLNLLVQAFYLMAEELRGKINFNGIGGLTMGPDPFLYALSLHWENLNDSKNEENPYMPLVVRKESKKHGAGRKIEGYVNKITKLLIFDDVVTTAGSMIQSVEAIRSEGIEITHAFSIIDRQEGGRENLEKAGLILHSLFQKSDFSKGNPED